MGQGTMMKKTRAANHITEWHEKYFETCANIPTEEARGCSSCKFGRAVTIHMEVPSGLYRSDIVPAKFRECNLLLHIVSQSE